MNIGKNIRNLRELKDLTQMHMAEELGIGQKTYSNIENSGNDITVTTILNVAKVLDVSFNKILELNAEAILNNNNQSGGISQLNTASSYNYSNEKALELYEKLLLEKDNRIEVLQKRVEELQKK
ncbi:MAG: helix-turn-helix transcriptional regulator [Bacteroidetes bacterium]|nr:helix-turn-helix transcriptional regulator [Bacteroidota bacterium]